MRTRSPPDGNPDRAHSLIAALAGEDRRVQRDPCRNAPEAEERVDVARPENRRSAARVALDPQIESEAGVVGDCLRNFGAHRSR